VNHPHGIVAGLAAGAFTFVGAAHGVGAGSTGSTDYTPLLVGGLISGFFAVVVSLITVFGRDISDWALRRHRPPSPAQKEATDALLDALTEEHTAAEKLRRQVEKLGGDPDA
jgi:hypothetical protein